MGSSLPGGVEPSAALVVKSLGITALAGLALFFTRLYQARTKFRNLIKKYDIVRGTMDPVDASTSLKLTCLQPILPHSFLFGHLIVVGKALAAYPADL
jgi:hypothetical protein